MPLRDTVCPAMPDTTSAPGSYVNPTGDFTRDARYIATRIRKELNSYPGARAVVQDLSQQGFTAQRGFPIEFARGGLVGSQERLLGRYGGDGAVGRDGQISNRILVQELSQLRALSGMVPLVFLGVTFSLPSGLVKYKSYKGSSTTHP